MTTMTSRRSFVVLLRANVLMALRSPVGLLGGFLIPVLLLVAFSAFNPTRIQSGPVQLAVVASGQAAIPDRLAETLLDSEQFDLHRYRSADDAEEAVRDGEMEAALVVTDDGTPRYYFDDTSIRQGRILTAPSAAIVRELQSSAPPDPDDTSAAQLLAATRPTGIHGGQADYKDFLFPGALIIGMMSVSFYAVPTVMGKYRHGDILRRLTATPLSASVFIGADVASRVLFALSQSVVAIAFATFVLDIDIRGSFAWLAALVALGHVLFLALGYVVAAFVRTPDGGSSAALILSLPFLVLSDLFFRGTQLSSVADVIVRYFPVNSLAELLRPLTLDGDAPDMASRPFIVVVAWTVVSAVAAVKLFRITERRD